MGAFLTSFPARCIDAVRIHRIRFGIYEGREGIFKQRRPGMGLMIWLGNRFLSWSRSGIEMFVAVREWRQREAFAFRLCHPAHAVREIGRNTLFFERLPGRSLRDLTVSSGLTPAIVTAAAQELRRCHGLLDPRTGEFWSHGDPHLGNFLFDEARCHLIDFETAHLASRSTVWRHADDLLVFCLELLGRGEGAAAVALAQTFVRSYGRPHVRDQLILRLKVPSGLERVLWQTRTEYLAKAKLKRRIEALRQALSADSQ